MASTQSRVSEVASIITSGTGTKERFGDMVFWALEVGRIDRQHLLKIWSGAGLDPGVIPEQNSFEKALKDAVSENTAGLKDQLLRKGLEDKNEVRFTLQQETKKAGGDNDYSQKAKFWVDKNSGAFSSSDPNNLLIQKVQADYHSLKDSHNTNDVRKAITNALHSFAAVTLRDGGGVYWIPEQFSADLRKLQSAVAQIGTSSIYLVPVVKTKDAQEALSAVAEGSLEKDLKELQGEIADFISAPPDRVSTLARRLDSFKELRGRANLYKMVLGATVQGLDEQLVKLEDIVQALIENKEAEKRK
jgi:hypothetical protein